MLRANPAFAALDILLRSGEAASTERERLDEIATLHRLADADRTVALAYFIGGFDGPIKIGFSVQPTARLADLRIASPVPLSLYAVVKGGKAREEAFHSQFAHLRLHGEWFRREPELLCEIRRIVRQARLEARLARRRNPPRRTAAANGQVWDYGRIWGW